MRHRTAARAIRQDDMPHRGDRRHRARGIEGQRRPDPRRIRPRPRNDEGEDERPRVRAVRNVVKGARFPVPPHGLPRSRLYRRGPRHPRAPARQRPGQRRPPPRDRRPRSHRRIGTARQSGRHLRPMVPLHRLCRPVRGCHRRSRERRSQRSRLLARRPSNGHRPPGRGGGSSSPRPRETFDARS